MLKKDYKYGTAEYTLEAAKEEIDKAIAKVQKMRFETLAIKPLSMIGFGGYPNPRISMSKIFKDYFAGTSYSSFDESKVEHIEKCYKAAMEWHDSALKEVEAWHLENLPVIEHNTAVQQNIRNFMEGVGIPASYPTYDYPTSRSREKKRTDYDAGFLEDIKRNCQLNDGYGAMKVKLADFKRDIESARAKYLEKIKITQAETAKADKQIRLVAKAMELATKWDIKAETNAELIAMVTEKEIEHYRKAMEGKVIDIKCCDYCNSWSVGEHRCFCGNRRMYLTIDGNIVDGFYHYPEAD